MTGPVGAVTTTSGLRRETAWRLPRPIQLLLSFFVSCEGGGEGPCNPPVGLILPWAVFLFLNLLNTLEARGGRVFGDVIYCNVFCSKHKHKAAHSQPKTRHIHSDKSPRQYKVWSGNGPQNTSAENSASPVCLCPDPSHVWGRGGRRRRAAYAIGINRMYHRAVPQAARGGAIRARRDPPP